MASFNKQSVREELERLKSDYKKQSEDGNKIPAETTALITGLFLLIELMFAIFLEKTTKKNSSNSGLSSANTGKDESSLNQGKTNSKGKAEKKEKAPNTRTIETVTRLQVTQCDQCGASLKDVECQCVERRTRIDIIFEKTVEHEDAEVKECPDCKKTVKAQFSSDMKGPLQYGKGIIAFAIQLIIVQMISLSRTQKMIKVLIGRVLSESTILAFAMRLYNALENWEKSAIETLLTSKSMNVDETSLRVDKKNHWIHVYSSGDITLKFLHKNRGKIAMEDIGIIPRYNGTIIHDCWGSYLSYKKCKHGLCGAHLLRELNFVIESNQYRWAKNMKKLLMAAAKTVSKRKRKVLTNKEYLKLQKNYRNILTRAEKELPKILRKKRGKRGKIAKSDAHNLWERLKKHETSVLRFACDPYVSFTNNRAERDLRMSKVKQKVSGCFRTVKYAKVYCRISSYLQTMANKGVNPLIAIQMALTGEGVVVMGE